MDLSKQVETFTIIKPYLHTLGIIKAIKSPKILVNNITLSFNRFIKGRKLSCETSVPFEIQLTRVYKKLVVIFNDNLLNYILEFIMILFLLELKQILLLYETYSKTTINYDACFCLPNTTNLNLIPIPRIFLPFLVASINLLLFSLSTNLLIT